MQSASTRSVPNVIAGGTRRVCAAVATACLLPYLTGCYVSRPTVAAAVSPDTEISLAITDAGRVALGERLGSGVLRINGRLVAAPDTAFRIRVLSLEFLNGDKTHWAGEEIRVPSSYVGNVSSREFSRTRTLLAAGIVVGALAVAIATTSLVGGGSESEGPKEPPGGQSTRSP